VLANARIDRDVLSKEVVRPFTIGWCSHRSEGLVARAIRDDAAKTQGRHCGPRQILRAAILSSERTMIPVPR